MSPLQEQIWAWMQGGDILMPIMIAVALVLYTILAERSLVLWGVRRQERHDELLTALRRGRDDVDGGRWRTWAATYVGLAEAEQLARGFTVARALTAVLPLLGLLGTVSGMIDTFAQIGTGGPAVGMASEAGAGAGIGLALTATQHGMALAMPAVVWEWLLARRVKQLVQDREVVVRMLQDAEAA